MNKELAAGSRRREIPGRIGLPVEVQALEPSLNRGGHLIREAPAPARSQSPMEEGSDPTR